MPKAGCHNDCSSCAEFFVRPAPITAPIYNIALVPGGHAAISMLPLMLTKSALNIAPSIGAAGMPLGIVSIPISDPAKRYRNKLSMVFN